MSLDDVLKKEFAYIDRDANQEKEEVKYFISVVKDNYDELLKSLKKIIETNGSSDEDISDERLYESTKIHIKELNVHSKGEAHVFDPAFYQFPQEIGWIEIKDYSESECKGKTILTEKGKKILKGYRETLGN